MGDAALSISIVIPTLNAGRAFGTILHRIMGQGQAPHEIVCADMGSTDGTRHIVSQFPIARFVEIAEPPGPRSWNRAMDEARGDVVVFLAQDAVPGNGDWLSHLTAPFSDPSVGGVYGRQEASLESDPLSGFRLGQRYCREAHWRRIRVGDAVRYGSLPFFIDNAAVRRSVWRGIHFNEHLPVGADRVWARQVVLASCTIVYTPDGLVIRQLHASLKVAYRLAVLTGRRPRPRTVHTFHGHVLDGYFRPAVQRGFIEVRARDGGMGRYPLLSISLGIATTRRRRYTTAHEAAAKAHIPGSLDPDGIGEVRTEGLA